MPVNPFRYRNRVLRGSLAGLLVFACVPLLSAGDRLEETWPSFQNGGRLSLVATVAGPLAPAERPNWTIRLPGSGQSSPVVWQDQVYVTSATGSQKELYHIAAYRLTDGEQLWQFDIKNPTPIEDAGYVSRAAPTPAADAQGLIAFLEGGLLIALTHEGEVRWQRNLVEDYGAVESRHGLSASVEQNDQLAFVWVERAEEPYVLAVDKSTGETRWQAPGLGVTSWASPRLAQVPGGEHLVLSGIGRLVGMNPEDGKQLWNLEGLAGNSTPTPVPFAEGRLLIGATDGRGEAGSGKNAETNGVVRIARNSEGAWEAAYEWRATKTTCSFGSPLAHQGQAYFVNRSGVVHCHDLVSGALRYMERIPGSIWATPVGLGESVLMFCKDGPQVALAAGTEFQVLASREPPAAVTGESTAPAAPIVYGVAVTERGLIVREGDSLSFRPLVPLSTTP